MAVVNPIDPMIYKQAPMVVLRTEVTWTAVHDASIKLERLNIDSDNDNDKPCPAGNRFLKP